MEKQLKDLKSNKNKGVDNGKKGCCEDKNVCDIKCKPVKNKKSSCGCGGNCC